MFIVRFKNRSSFYCSKKLKNLHLYTRISSDSDLHALFTNTNSGEMPIFVAIFFLLNAKALHHYLSIIKIFFYISSRPSTSSNLVIPNSFSARLKARSKFVLLSLFITSFMSIMLHLKQVFVKINVSTVFLIILYYIYFV